MTSTSAARPDRVNEDFAGAVPTAAVLVDGAGIPGSGWTCSHGVAWYATRLGGSLLGLLSLVPDRGLPTLLAEAIEQVTDVHRDSCHVADVISPSAAVAVLRVSGGLAECAVLGDATVVLDRTHGAPLVFSDPREVVISRSYEPALDAARGGDAYLRVLGELRSHRNRPGGFWVAKDDPRAADEAVTGSCPVSELSGAAALFSNGASGIVDRFGLCDWPEVMTVLASDGPDAVIRRVRRTEARHAVASDDATVVYCTGLGAP
ncbi:integrase [Streptomyces sp. NBC_01012]|uniref:integrase n=1 Tax=Streptomyces sp. NBC_01012 TaxID=2903717 RepID=UPI00386F95C0|nr:integrase [Streptomyces sp. NBC_01012]